jgi:hypothetical protein
MEELPRLHSGKVRRPPSLAIVCSLAVALFILPLGIPFFLLTIPLILGVIADFGTPRRGRWLMWLGAGYVSVTLLQMEIVMLSEILAEIRSHHTGSGWGVFLFVSIASIVCCDVVLLIDAVNARQHPATFDASFIGWGDWIVWGAALCVSVYAFAAIPLLVRVHQLHAERSDILLTDLASILIVAIFDVALVRDAVKTVRARRIARR